ncbi:hypothetical protein [Mesorhizobium sp. M0146]|uniref:hypothetical protein n=1 Tax=unclassified Mesorhizobium TaxID=325217 RepID=UPI00333A43F4
MTTGWRELATAQQSSANEMSQGKWLSLILYRISHAGHKRVRNKLASAKQRFPEARIEGIDFPPVRHRPPKH